MGEFTSSRPSKRRKVVGTRAGAAAAVGNGAGDGEGGGRGGLDARGDNAQQHEEEEQAQQEEEEEVKDTGRRLRSSTRRKTVPKREGGAVGGVEAGGGEVEGGEEGDEGGKGSSPKRMWVRKRKMLVREEPTEYEVVDGEKGVIRTGRWRYVGGEQIFSRSTEMRSFEARLERARRENAAKKKADEDGVCDVPVDGDGRSESADVLQGGNGNGNGNGVVDGVRLTRRRRARAGERVEDVEEEEEEAEEDYDISALQLQQDLVHNDDTTPAELEELPPYAAEFKEFCEENELEGHVQSLAKVVLKKLTGKSPVPLRALDSEYQTVHQLVEQTVVAGEGNSLLLLGSRGCGKTAVVETVISSLAKDHKDDFHVVRLNGFLHTDDRIALREIWRQLGREMNAEEDMSKTISYADTMASLLALLSHPEELFGISEDPNAVATAKSVIIVLDEFDLFAHHPRQTLLYNLFDIAQARKAPLAVLGLTTKVDVTENLEKRVKSRFSHRYVFLPRPRTFADFSDICMAAMGLDEAEIELYQDDRKGLSNSQGLLLLEGWSKYLQGLWSDPAFSTHLQQIYHQTKSPKDFFSSALLPISTLCHSLPQFSNTSSGLRPPTPKSFYSQPLSCPDPASLPFPPSTSSTSNTSLPLSLLLAATRYTAIHDPGLNANHPQTAAPLTLTFPAVYAEYVRLLTSAKVSASASGVVATPGRVWGKDVAREAWERLIGWGLVVPVGGGSGMGDGRMFRIEISFEEVVDGVGNQGVGALGRWWRET
ncbi:hypothetical protein FQN50_002785 [Emmonsiellopsis sp. PD_5]|nr:hypothetical protein FQN50_002785 [Emmonsiellopsis sp. PD_5]